MGLQCGLDRTLDEVVDDDLRRVVGAGCLALPRGRVEVRASGWRDDFIVVLRGDVCAVPVDGEVLFGEREAGFEQALVDGAELAHLEAAEVDRPRGLVDGVLAEEFLEGGADHAVGESDAR